MTPFMKHLWCGLVAAGLAVSLVSTTPRVAVAASARSAAESLYCPVYPDKVPADFGHWTPQRFWIPRHRFPGDAVADPIRFTLTRGDRFTTAADRSYALYDNVTVEPVTINNVEWMWADGATMYQCIGLYPFGLWSMWSEDAFGEAIPVYQDNAVTSSGTGSTTTGGEGDNPVCIEFYEWWYTADGAYHERVTGHECFGYAV